MEIYDVIIIGGGQAGLSAAYYLKKEKMDILILEKNDQIGDNWRERYDSLVLFTSKKYSKIADIPYDDDSDSVYPKKDEVADYLNNFCVSNDLPIQLATKVEEITKDETFIIKTNNKIYRSKNIVIATGSFQHPFIPGINVNATEDIVQIHSSEYKNKTQLKKGTVAVVGGGNSGAQIAKELCDEFDVLLSVSQKPKFLPQRLFGKSIFYWLDAIGMLGKTIDSKIGKWWSKQPDPLFGYTLKKKINKGKIRIKPRLMDIKGKTLFFSDGSKESADNIIWCTGFKQDFSFIKIDGLTDETGKIKHERGVSEIEGIYFIGMPWQSKRTSALIHGVADDAKFIVEMMRKKNYGV